MGGDTGNIVVSGDHWNGPGVFAAAGTRVAVTNAREEAKAPEYMITASNNEDGVAVFFEKSSE
ncbi:HAD hydrolase family protein [Paenibacillus sp. S150]|uniref:HAD hydrolase family protein n=1 Tax=Paenibacillus sp. S150 TaxID=2749826 RepID=UPI001C59A14E|nr:HAD hydrolase family protein [Paenibacillus sp. S150]MBW4083118.1 HAD hydrolase family protein [Paenibacillus sp. S150]